MVLKNISYLKNKVQMFSHQPSAAEHKIGNISYLLFFSPNSSIQVQTDGLRFLSINWGDKRIEDWSLSSLSWVYWNPNSFSWKNVQSRQWKQISNRTNSTTIYARIPRQAGQTGSLQEGSQRNEQSDLDPVPIYLKYLGMSWPPFPYSST